MNKIILVFYVGIGSLSDKKANKYIKEYIKCIEHLDVNIYEIIVVPTRTGESYITRL